MKRILLTSAATIGALCLGIGATQAREDGFYIGVGAGYNLPHEQDLDVTNADQNIEHTGGPGGLATFGFKYEEGWRAELEAGYRSSAVDSISGASGNGDVDAWTLIVNGLYDFEADGFTPYVGVGAGLAYVNFDGVSPIGTAGGGTTSLNEKSEPALALQALAGVAVDLTDSLALTGQYNFLAIPEVHATTANGTDARSEFYNHMFTVGLRYSFPVGKSMAAADPEPEPMPAQAAVEAAPEPVAEPEPLPPIAEAPPPPPPPPPAVEEPEITRNFLVYFDWDKAELSPATEAILRQAAKYAEDGKVARIILTGHADTSGPKAYNMTLSQKRSDQVRAMLVQLGQPATGIVTFARGEAEPLVDTGDGVREAKNRRVEIVLE